MTLNEWEQSNIEVLTSREMGEWLCCRENRLLERIRNEIANEKGTFPKEHYIRIIDKYKGDKE